MNTGNQISMGCLMLICNDIQTLKNMYFRSDQPGYNNNLPGRYYEERLPLETPFPKQKAQEFRLSELNLWDETSCVTYMLGIGSAGHHISGTR